MDLKSKLRIVEDFPKKGIKYVDITTLIKDGNAFRRTIDTMLFKIKDLKPDLIVGPEARGFIFGPIIAYELGIGFVPARKSGKLPAKTVSYKYDLEYGSDELQIHEDAIKAGQKVVIVDDLLATGGTIFAIAKLVEKMGAEVIGIETVIELPKLNGREKLKEYYLKSLVKYDFE